MKPGLVITISVIYNSSTICLKILNDFRGSAVDLLEADVERATQVCYARFAFLCSIVMSYVYSWYSVISRELF